MQKSSGPRVDFEIVRQSGRLNAPDRYYAALFAPEHARRDLIGLAAFTGEVERIARVVGDAAVGEIRIAWWRDSLAKSGTLEATGNPVLDGFADVVARRGLPLDVILAYLDAEADALLGGPEDETALEQQFRTRDRAPLALAAAILAVHTGEAETSRVLDQAGRAAGMTRTARELPCSLTQGHSPLPEMHSPSRETTVRPASWTPHIEWLEKEAREAIENVRHQLAAVPPALITALLPLALVEPYFRALQKAGKNPARGLVEIPPLVRLWRIARAHWSGRI